MELQNIFKKLWSDYTQFNPSAGKIMELFKNEGESVVNDHIAFRTLHDPRIDIDAVARPFVKHGYQQSGEYVFKDKHLFAKHYELNQPENAPRIFISQLLLDDVSNFIRDTFRNELDRISNKITNKTDLIFSGSVFSPLSYEVYSKLRKESEYAAWFYVFGFRSNHFTVSVNALTKNDSLEKVNQLLEKNGFKLNTSGGAIKGSPQDLLRQSSTLADAVRIRFKEGAFDIPCCYYEFAQRYKKPDGKLFSGFIAQSADKIFESTDNYVAKNQS